MNEALDPFRLHAYVDGELTADEMAAIDRALVSDPQTAADVAALRAQRTALRARYDRVLDEPHRLTAGRSHFAAPSLFGPWWQGRAWVGSSIAATLVIGVGVGLATGWFARGQSDHRAAARALQAGAAQDARLGDFVRVAAVSHAVFTPEVRHPVEVTAADEAHLVAWLSKRLDAPLVVPHLGEAGWNLLGGRLLPAELGPVAQFMYQDAQGRRLTLAVSHPKRDLGPGAKGDLPGAAFRIADEGGNTVFYWIDGGYAYALTGRLARAEMTELAGRVYRAVDRAVEHNSDSEAKGAPR